MLYSGGNFSSRSRAFTARYGPAYAHASSALRLYYAQPTFRLAPAIKLTDAGAAPPGTAGHLGNLDCGLDARQGGVFADCYARVNAMHTDCYGRDRYCGSGSAYELPRNSAALHARSPLPAFYVLAPAGESGKI